MKPQKSVHIRSDELPPDFSSQLKPVIISIIGHVVLLGLFIWAPKFGFRQDFQPRVINVTLVAMPGGGVASPKKSGAPSGSPQKAAAPKEAPAPPKAEPEPPKVEPPPQKAEPKPPESKKPEVKETPPEPVKVAKEIPDKDLISLSPKKIAPKESLKKKTFQPAAVLESAVKRIEKKVEESKQEPSESKTDPAESKQEAIKSAIERMRSAVEKGEVGKGSARGSGKGASQEGDGDDAGVSGEGPAGNGTASGTGPGIGQGGLELIDIYRVEIASHIKKNWAYSDQMADKSKNLTVWVMIEVMRDGRIKDFWFEKRSGNAYLDDSVARAIQKSNPLPPFPAGVRQSSIHQGFRFTPSGMQ